MADPRSEPSMEDILASIKRIIADDQPAPPQPRAALPEPRAAVPEIARPQPIPSFPPRDAALEPPPSWPRRTDPKPPESILELTDRAPEPYQPPRAVEPPRAQPEEEMPRPATRPVPRDLLPRTPAPATPRAATAGVPGDITLDALVREMLQPILADWVDRNLPDMVERLVQAEIQKMMAKGE